MRWDNLFDDLEGQLEHEADAEQGELLAEQERLRLGRLALRDRIASIAGQQSTSAADAIRVQLLDGSAIAVRPTTFGKDWLAADLVAEQSSLAQQCILPLGAIAGLALTPRQIRESLEPQVDARPTGRLVDRIGLAFVLRDLCRRRKNLELQTMLGRVHGTIDRVGRDHLDLAVHEPGSSRHESNVTDYRVVPVQRILLLRV
jgi:hypothetical protein